MVDQVELLPCPFCGLRNVKTLPGITRVICMTPECDAEMGGPSTTVAIARWNIRNPPHPNNTGEV